MTTLRILDWMKNARVHRIVSDTNQQMADLYAVSSERHAEILDKLTRLNNQLSHLSGQIAGRMPCSPPKAEDADASLREKQLMTAIHEWVVTAKETARGDRELQRQLLERWKSDRETLKATLAERDAKIAEIQKELDEVFARA